MELAALILSIISLILGIAAIVWLLAKQFSTHRIQYVDPLATDKTEPGQIGNNIFDQFRELGDPIDSEELEEIERLRTRKIK